MIHYDEIINFWFNEITSSQWWVKDEAFDQLIRERYLGVLEMGLKGELFVWRTAPLGRLAEIIVLDQFSRNIYRNDPRAFAGDSMALALAQEAVGHGVQREMASDQQQFLFMPYMHSESLIIHEQAVLLFSGQGMENNLDFEVKHKNIIERFGRYPHRNEILGRTSTPEEVTFLMEPGSSF